MRLATLFLATAILTAETTQVAWAQDYPQLPQASGQTALKSTNPSALATCGPNGASGATLADAVTAGVNCTFGPGTVGQNVDFLFERPTGGTSIFDPGNVNTYASGTSTPLTGTVTSTSGSSGTLHTGFRARGNSEASQYFYVTIADPSSVFRIALDATWSQDAQVTPLSGWSFQDRNAWADAEAQICAWTLDANEAIANNTGCISKSTTSDTQQGFGTSTQVSDENGNGSYVPNSVTGFDVAGSSLNAGGMFAFYIRAATQFIHRNTNGSDYFSTESVSSQISAPTIRLYDANGSEIFNQITIDRGGVPPVTPTPEPASLALLATGLLGLVGVSRRRKRSA